MSANPYSQIDEESTTPLLVEGNTSPYSKVSDATLESGSTHSAGNVGKIAYDPHFSGIVKDREYKDRVWGWLFGCVLVAFIILSIVVSKKQDVSMLQEDSESKTHWGKWYMQHQIESLTTGRTTSYIVQSVVYSLMYGCIMIAVLKYAAKVAVYTCIFAGLAMMGFFGIYLTSAGCSEGNTTFKIVGPIILVMTCLLVVITFLLRKKLSLTCMFIEQSCSAALVRPMVFVVSFVMVAIYIAACIWWIVTMVYLYSIPKGEGEDSYLDGNIRQAAYFVVFAGLWASAVLHGVTHHTVAGSVASWYFAQRQPGGGDATLTSLGHALSTSFGSICLGSLVLAAVQFINFLLEEARKNSQNNVVARYILCCFQCCMKCIEGIVQMVNRYAFIYVAMYGESFCTSAKKVFQLFGRNPLMTVVADTITHFVLFLGKMVGVCIVSFVVFGYHNDEAPVFVPAMIAIVVSFSILTLITYPIGVGVDTIYVCYVEDTERQEDGGAVLMDAAVHSKCAEMAERESASS